MMIASGKKGNEGSPKLDYDDDAAWDARGRLTQLWHDRSSNSAAGKAKAQILDERIADRHSKWE